MESFITPEVEEVALSLMEGLNCPRSLTVAIMLRYNEGEQLVKLKCDPEHYLTSLHFFKSTIATDFLRKSNAKIEGIDPQREAELKWEAGEADCFHTNRRLYSLVDSGLTMYNGSLIDPRLAQFIRTVQSSVYELLGGSPPPTDSALRSSVDGRFGPGATVSDVSRRTTVLDKMTSTPSLTPSALGFLFPWMGTEWGRACALRDSGVRFVRGNSFFTVPKDALTHRSCAKEPSLNSFYQLGLGRAIRKRLKSHGYDLEHGQNIHRQVACAASRSGEFCTIDLSNASDTLCRALVELLLPTKWFESLNSLRSSHTLYKGKWRRLEKFSSMGNGFTFELETTVFAAICRSVLPEYLREFSYVYGDDIIVPTSHAHEVIAALKFFGFKTNERKTFWSGNFRESCGGDFFNGDAVRAHFLKEMPREPQDYISLANGIKRLAVGLNRCAESFSLPRHSWFRCLDFLPSNVRHCRGPKDLGDVVIHDEESRWSVRWRGQIRYVRVYRPARFKRIWFGRYTSDVQYSAALYGVALSRIPSFRMAPEGVLDPRGVIPRDGVIGYKVGWLAYS